MILLYITKFIHMLFAVIYTIFIIHHRAQKNKKPLYVSSFRFGQEEIYYKKPDLKPHLQFYSLRRYIKKKISNLRDISEIILNVRWIELPESVRVANANFDIVRGHLSLEALFQRKNGGVNGIVQLQVLAVPLLEEGFAVDEVLAHRGRLPRKIRAGRIALEQVRLVVVPTAYQKGHAEGSDTAAN